MCWQALLGLQQVDAKLGKRLFAVVSDSENKVTLEQLVIAQARCLKASSGPTAMLAITVPTLSHTNIAVCVANIISAHSSLLEYTAIS